MPKVKSKRTRAEKSQPFDTMMVDEELQNPVVEEQTGEENQGESNHAVFKRHAGEWKKMKGQIAQLKKQRKALTKKQRDKKKQISQEIKLLMHSLRDRQDEELRALGIISAKRSDLMMDDDEEDD